MKTHCRCRRCRARKKLNKHPFEYRIQPRCSCGARDWIRDAYRHRTELQQIREGTGRYVRCGCAGHALVLHYPHRRGSVWCNYQADGQPKTLEQFQAEQNVFDHGVSGFIAM